ncbi:MAG: type II secretion system protein [Sulfuricaulis sp.]|uniref:type IV pilus modification PilV family protein n=1 Tax=Sulfuricaulis sp. TaxID=2003553 RepID=UPI0034A4077E
MSVLKKYKSRIIASGQRGLTLIEVIAFIVIVGVLVSGLMSGFSVAMRGSGVPKQVTLALQLAQERMELIRARKDIVGFACFTGTRFDPCTAAALAGSCPAMPASTHPACNAATTFGFTITPVLDETGVCLGGDTNYKCITVTVTDGGGVRLSELQAAVANY